MAHTLDKDAFNTIDGADQFKVEVVADRMGKGLSERIKALSLLLCDADDIVTSTKGLVLVVVTHLETNDTCCTTFLFFSFCCFLSRSNSFFLNTYI